MPQIIIINGQGGAGKSTFVDFCKKNYWLVEEYSTVDFVKYLAKKSGWNGEKTLKNRKFLSDLKDLLTNWNDTPFKKTVEFCDKTTSKWDCMGIDTSKGIIFIHCREPEEIEKLCKELEATSLLITCPQTKNKKYHNHADDNVFSYSYTYTISNDGTLEDLNKKAIEFINRLINK